MFTLDRGIDTSSLPPTLLSTCTDFAHALATCQAGPSSAGLLSFFRGDAFFMPHNHDRPQEGIGALRTYWRRHAGLFTGSLVDISKIEVREKGGQPVFAMVRFKLQMRQEVMANNEANLGGIVNLSLPTGGIDDEPWLISHLWLRQETSSNRPTNKIPKVQVA